jgi:hypothetical protein
LIVNVFERVLEERIPLDHLTRRAGTLPKYDN